MLQTSQGIVAHPGSDRRVSWIIGRRFLRHNLFEVADTLPEGKRRSALALLVRKWSPFADTEFAVQWRGTKASVYAWDNTEINNAITAAGEDPRRCTPWPETFFRPPRDDGAGLAEMAEGVEGQVWKQGLLVATRWWPAAPPAREWMMFLRGAGLDLTQAPDSLPVQANGALLTVPWTAQNTPITNVWGLVQNSRVAAIAATIVAAPFFYFLAQAAVLAVGTLRAEGAIASMNVANQSLRADRTSALANLDTVDSYLSLEKFPPQFGLMAAATDLIKDKNVSIGEWTFDSGNLDLVLQADHALDAALFIEAFERDEHFSGVSGTLGNQERELRLRMQVDPRKWSPS